MGLSYRFHNTHRASYGKLRLTLNSMFTEDEVDQKILLRDRNCSQLATLEAFYKEKDNKRLTVNAPKYMRLFSIECS